MSGFGFVYVLVFAFVYVSVSGAAYVSASVSVVMNPKNPETPSNTPFDS